MEDCFVKILAYSTNRDENEAFLGVGVLADSNTIITCNHIKRKKFKIDTPNEYTVEFSEVIITFPLLSNTEKIRAVIFKFDSAIDIALIKLKIPLGNIFKPAKFSTSANIKHRKIEAFGYPILLGTHAEGEIKGPIEGGLYEIQDNINRGYFIQPGFSGGGIFDLNSGACFGIAQFSVDELERRLAYFMPIKKLKERWPDDIDLLIVPDSYLNEKVSVSDDPSKIFKDINFKKKKITELDSIRCDRNEIIDHCIENFNPLKNSSPTKRVKCYILPGADIQQPMSLEKRIHLELESSFEEHYSISPWTEKNTIIKGTDNDGLKLSFIKAMNECLGLENNYQIKTISEFYQSSEYEKSQDLIVIPLKIELNQWIEGGNDFVQWIINDFFKNAQEKKPYFLILLNIRWVEATDMDNKFSLKNYIKTTLLRYKLRQQIDAKLRLIKNENPKIVDYVSFARLKNIQTEDLIIWMEEYLPNRENIDILLERISNAHYSNIPNLLNHQNEMPMSRAEFIMQQILKYYEL